MSDRERWIVYPLLFLSIGLSMRNSVKLDEDHESRKAAELNVIRCKGLEVVAADGKPRWILGTTLAGEGLLELKNSEDKPTARLTNNATGALLGLFNNPGNNAIGLGYEGQHVFLVNSDLVAGLERRTFLFPILPPAAQEPPPQKLESETPTAPETPDKKGD